jgi:hypothetical protein
MKPHILIARRYWEHVLKPGDTVIDATLGNGHDALFLAQLLQGKGKLICYEIQEKAIEQAKKRLQELPVDYLNTIQFKHQSHHSFEEEGVKLIVYNLGYLPGGDKKITTLRETTLKSLERGLGALCPKGAISITCYPGHEEGAHEEKLLLDYLRTLPAAQWQICYHQWINRPASPSLIWLQAALPCP